MVVSADASYAPGGGRSRSGVVISIFGKVIHWVSQRQPLASRSSCEAELNAAVIGVRLGIGVRNMVEEMISTETCLAVNADAVLSMMEQRETTIPLTVLQDNQACMTTITAEVTSWRSRHYSIRATWIRDVVFFEQIDVVYVQGSSIVADALTKILGKLKLKDARQRLCLEDGCL